MEPEDILSRLNINSIIFQHEVIGVVQFLAPCDVYFTEIETRSDELPEGLPGDVGTANVNVFKIWQLLSKSGHPGVLEIAASEEADFAQEAALGKLSNAMV